MVTMLVAFTAPAMADDDHNWNDNHWNDNGWWNPWWWDNHFFNNPFFNDGGINQFSEQNVESGDATQTINVS